MMESPKKEKQMGKKNGNTRVRKMKDLPNTGQVFFLLFYFKTEE